MAVRVLADHGAEILIHCGDLTDPEMVYECSALPGYFVLGNNDIDEEGIHRAVAEVGGVFLGQSGVVELAGRTLAVAHGDVERELRRMARARPDYLLFGHSHKPHDEREGPTRWINPGALHRAAQWTFALLDLETDALQLLTLSKTVAQGCRIW